MCSRTLNREETAMRKVDTVRKAVTRLRPTPNPEEIPLAGGLYYDMAVVIVQSLPALDYPIASARELVAKHASSGQTVNVAGFTFDPKQTLQFVPAYYFPIASAQNLVEKLGELLRNKARSVGLRTEFAAIKAQMPPTLRYPIESPRQLLDSREPGRTYYFRGTEFDPADVVRGIPLSWFPVTDEGDFDQT